MKSPYSMNLWDPRKREKRRENASSAPLIFSQNTLASESAGNASADPLTALEPNGSELHFDPL